MAGHRLVIAATGERGTLRLAGELDASNADELARALEQDSSDELTLDLRELEFLDSSGLQVLIRAARRLEGRGHLVLVSPQEHVRRLFAVSGVDRVVRIVDGL
jgi:stage II sporulation protein AA (anti-sigma F factor antagonist)